VISIGVTGHRSLSDIDTISILVDEALNKIVTAFGERSLQIISPLAKGADRLVVWRAFSNYDTQLVVPLPLALSEYLLDFPSETSQTEFLTLLAKAEQVIELPYAGSREACYQSAGMFVLNHCDVLIAIWNGMPAGGVGGTGEIVSEARNRRLPIAWVHTSDHNKERITFENFLQERND